VLHTDAGHRPSLAHCKTVIHYLQGNCFTYPRAGLWTVSGAPGRTEEAAMKSRQQALATEEIPRWLRFVLKSDRAGSSWYIGTGFFFAPVLAIVSPWPALTTVLWIVLAVAGLWLGLLGVAMATGLAMVLRSNREIPEDCWRSILDYPPAPKVSGARGT
jgi:hypothetical protein